MAMVTFREERCKGCGLCVIVCPKKIIELDSSRINEMGYKPAAVKDMEACIGCAMCANMCPDAAIEVFR